MNLTNYELIKGKIYRKKYFCEKSKKVYQKKELKTQNIRGYEYVYINGKLMNVDRVKLYLK